MQLNKKAWSLLTEDEKIALNLQFGMQKSSWQSGEIMQKSHYKYLEIKYRAEKFLKMFTEHLNFFEEVIPKEVRGNEEVIMYFRLVIGEREKISKANSILNEKFGYSGIKTREQDIYEQMKKWEISEDAYSQITYNLIKEFDRWNNFRILPKELQEPSAFKRRNKNIHKKHIRISTSIPSISIPKIKQFYGVKPKKAKVYLPVVCDKRMIHVMEVRDTEVVLNELTQLHLYIFKDKKIAKEYIDLLFHYTEDTKKSCNEGLEFWPKYREIIKNAKNYEPIQKIVPSRRYLQLALRKLSFF